MIRELISADELREIAIRKDLFRTKKWNMLMMHFFLLVPEKKYISRIFITEILKEWGVYKSWHDHLASTAMLKLSNVGLLERQCFNEASQLLGSARMAFCEEHVFGPVKKATDGRRGNTRAVFRITAEGRKFLAETA